MGLIYYSQQLRTKNDCLQLIAMSCVCVYRFGHIL